MSKDTVPLHVQEQATALLAHRKPPARAICSEGSTRLPRSAMSRHAVTWLKLLTKVDPRAQGGFGFEGKLLRPGDSIALETLPSPAVLLECAGGKGRNPECLYILWRWDPQLLDWTDVAQAKSTGPEWALALREIACRELQGVTETPDAQRIAQRIEEFIDAELYAVPDETRKWVAGYLHDRIAHKLVA